MTNDFMKHEPMILDTAVLRSPWPCLAGPCMYHVAFYLVEARAVPLGSLGVTSIFVVTSSLQLYMYMYSTTPE